MNSISGKGNSVFKKIFWLLFVTSVIWGSRLPGIGLPSIGTLYPLRIIILVFPLYIMLKGKWIIKNTQMNTFCYFAIMFLTGILTLFWTINISTAITSLIVYITDFFVVIICYYFIADRYDILYIAKAYTLNVILICVIGIYESITGNYIFNYTIYEHYTRTFNFIGLYRPLVFFYNINDLATFLVLSIPICFIAFENSKKKSIKKWFLFTLCAIVIILIGSRAAILGIFFLVILFLFNKLKLSKIFFSMFSVIISLLLFILSPYFRSVVLSLKNEGRLNTWLNTLLVSLDYYFMGVGPGNSYYGNMLNQYVNMGGVYAVHNYLLELLCEFGVIGFGCFTLLIFYFVLKIKRYNKYASLSDKYMLNMFYDFIIIFILLSICPSSMSEMYFIWLYFGVGTAIINFTNKGNIKVGI